jgi:hypothetical protein
MVVPEIAGAVGEKLDGQSAAASEDQKTSGGGTKIYDRPKSALHRFAPFFMV